MCILFMYVANRSNIGAAVSPYKLILASNRDEKLSRRTEPAKFWEDPNDSHILAGQDLEELGTWLGISKQGKLAILLNIMGASSTTASSTENENISRGSLVTGFLRSPPGLPGCTYLKNLCHLDISGVYKPFHLITVDLLGCKPEASKNKCVCKYTANNVPPNHIPASICVCYLTNPNTSDDAGQSNCSSDSNNICSEPKHVTPPANTCKYYAFGNSMIDKPFRKVELGKIEFEKIVTRHLEKYDDEEYQKSLVEDILHFLKSTEKHFPDERITERARGTKIPEKLLPLFSSRFVSIPGVDYGTRTHTIVLVDMKNNVIFHEWTLMPQINPSSPAHWSHVKFTFSLNSSA